MCDEGYCPQRIFPSSKGRLCKERDTLADAAELSWKYLMNSKGGERGCRASMEGDPTSQNHGQ